MAKYGRTIKWKKTYQGFSDALGKAGEHLTGWAREWMADAVEKSLDTIDSEWSGHVEGKNGTSFGGDRFHPWYTGTLHDSVAGIVSDKNRIVAVRYMPERADGPQEYLGYKIVGVDWARYGADSISRSLRFASGIYATVVVGVPYADKVDESSRHAGFIRELSNQFAANVEDYFTEKAEGYRTRVFRTDKKKK